MLKWLFALKYSGVVMLPSASVIMPYIKKSLKLRLFQRFCFSVIRLGFEPKTHSLEGCCSIQLSYRTNPCFCCSPRDGTKADANVGINLRTAK